MMCQLNKAQRRGVHRKWTQDNQGLTYRKFRSTVVQGICCPMVWWSGMWLGIEEDGETHS
jgi:hypothetical protein